LFYLNTFPTRTFNYYTLARGLYATAMSFDLSVCLFVR